MAEAITVLGFPEDAEGNRGHFLRRFSNNVDARVLAASSAEAHTVPTGAKFVIFSSESDFYARVGGTAAIPSGDVTDGTASELNPVGYAISGETSIGLISETAQVITMAFYR